MFLLTRLAPVNGRFMPAEQARRYTIEEVHETRQEWRAAFGPGLYSVLTLEDDGDGHQQRTA
jgi:hypothetical protein